MCRECYVKMGSEIAMIAIGKQVDKSRVIYKNVTVSHVSCDAPFGSTPMDGDELNDLMKKIIDKKLSINAMIVC